MPLIYSFVARGTIVLADYTSYSGNFSTVAIQCLEKCPTDGGSKFTYTCDKHTFNYVVSGGFTYLVVADEAYGRQIPYAFLERVRDEFTRNWAERSKAAPAHSLDKSFGPKLKEQMEYCMAHPEELTKVAAVQKRVDEVKNIMVDNIEKVLERGEKIELLVDKSENLRDRANQFQTTGRQLRRKMWWNNVKIKIFLAVLVLVVVLVIFFIACFSGGNCFK